MLPGPVHRVPLPPNETIHRLVAVFCANRWPNYPIFFRTDFVNMIPQASANESSSFLLYMVLAIASIDLQARQTTPDVPSGFDLYLTAVRFHLEGALAADDITSIQSLLLLAIFAMSDSRGVSLWHTTGIIMRMCIDLGLHRLSDPASFNSAIELQKRIFWCAFALESSVCGALGRPPSLTVEEITTPLPLTIDDPLSLDTPALPDITAFIHTIRLRGYNGMIQSVCYAPTNPTLADCVSRPPLTSHQADVWRQATKTLLDQWLQDAPQYPAPHSSTYKSPDWFSIAHSHSTLLLFRPSSTHPHLSPETMQICADASMTLIMSYLRLYTYSKGTSPPLSRSSQ